MAVASSSSCFFALFVVFAFLCERGRRRDKMGEVLLYFFFLHYYPDAFFFFREAGKKESSA